MSRSSIGSGLGEIGDAQAPATQISHSISKPTTVDFANTRAKKTHQWHHSMSQQMAHQNQPFPFDVASTSSTEATKGIAATESTPAIPHVSQAPTRDTSSIVTYAISHLFETPCSDRVGCPSPSVTASVCVRTLAWRARAYTGRLAAVSSSGL